MKSGHLCLALCAINYATSAFIGGTIDTLVGSSFNFSRGGGGFDSRAIWVAPSGDAYVTSIRGIVRFESGVFGPRQNGMLMPLDITRRGDTGSSFVDGQPAALACVSDLSGAVTDSLGNLVFYGRTRTASGSYSGLFSVHALDGTIHVFARAVPCGEGAPSDVFCAGAGGIMSLAIGFDDTIYAVDRSESYFANRVWAVNSTSGLVKIFAGDGMPGYHGDGGPAVNASVNAVAVAADLAGNVYIADIDCVRVVRASDGVINKYAGRGPTLNDSSFCGGDGEPALQACVVGPSALAVSSVGDLYIVDYSSIRVVWASNLTVDTFAGNGSCEIGDIGDGTPARDACLRGEVRGIALDGFGNLLIMGSLDEIRVVWAENATIDTLSRGLSTCPESGDLGSRICIRHPAGLSYSPSGDLFISDGDVFVLPRSTGVVSRVTGDSSGDSCEEYRDGMPAKAACIAAEALTVDGTGNVFVAAGARREFLKEVVARAVYIIWASNSTMYRYAGGGNSSADGVPARNATFFAEGLAVSCAGDLLITDRGSNRLRVVWASNQTMGTYAGNGSQYPCGDGGCARDACLGSPSGVAVDASSCNIFVSSQKFGIVRVIHAQNGSIDTLAGNMSSIDTFGGDGGPATAAGLHSPGALAVDSEGNVLVVDNGNDRIRIVWAKSLGIRSQTIDTFAGGGTSSSFCGDKGLATDACLSLEESRFDFSVYGIGPLTGVAVDQAGNVVIADYSNGRVRIVVASDDVQCPPGYTCPYGVPSAPCLTAGDGYCPGDTFAPVPVYPGYYALASPEAPAGSLTGQRLCPPGGYCNHGVYKPCPSGTTGSGAGKSTPDACVECPPGTYAALGGLTGVNAGCASCPLGSVAPSAGSSFCSWCLPGTAHDVSGGLCTPCPSGFFSMGGSFPCAHVPNGAKPDVWDNFAVLSEATVTPLGNGEPPGSFFTQYSLPTAAALVLLAGLPALYLAVAWLCRSRADKLTVDARIRRMLRTVDQFGLNHSVSEGEAPVMRSTAHGGALAFLAVGIAAAIAFSLVIDFVASNDVPRMPLMAPTMSSYANITSAVARRESTNIFGAPASGLRVRILSMGPACSSVTWLASNLLAGNFSHSAAVNATSGAATHDFDCPGCALMAISSLDVSFDATCQTFVVYAYAVSSTGFVSVASYAAAAPCGPRYSDATVDCSPFRPAVAMAMTLDLLEVDGVNSARGFTVSPPATLPPVGGNVSSGLRLLRVALPLSSAYIAKAVDKKTTLAQLVSSILGLVGILSAAGMALSMLEAVPGHYEALMRRLRNTSCRRSSALGWAKNSHGNDCEAALVVSEMTPTGRSPSRPLAESELIPLMR